jgi:perosamine synthetase
MPDRREGVAIFVAKDPKLHPSMLLPRRTAVPARFPFTDPTIQYWYLGRNASYALIKLLGLAGHEMLFPAYFGGPVLEAPLAAGARIRFYPVREGMRVDPADIRARITPETRAIYLIHFAGFPGPVEDVQHICREHGLVLIEDCAHALLSSLGDRPLGTFGDGAIFSFYKWVPVPNGAALTLRHPHGAMPRAEQRQSRTSGLALSAFSLLDHLALRWGAPGRALRGVVRAAGRSASHATGLAYVLPGGITFEHEHLDLGMSGIARHILVNQDFDSIIARRRRNYAHLADLLAGVAPPIQGALPPGVTPLFYATRVLYKRAVVERLRAKGVEARSFWEFHHPLLPPGVMPETDDLRQTVLELPIHQDLAPAAIERMARAVRETIGVKAIVGRGIAVQPACACTEPEAAAITPARFA